MTETTKFYSNIIVIGSNSSISDYVLQAFRIEKQKLFGIYNENLEISRRMHYYDKNLVSFKSIGDSPSELMNLLSINIRSNALILNFSGVLGPLSPFVSASSNEILETINNNFRSFIFSAKVLSLYGPNSLLISFCGAGVGGSNLDDSSLGYLASKSGIVVLNEALDDQLRNSGHRLCLVSPGAFPSNMQRAVAEAPETNVDLRRREQAKSTLEVGAKHPERILSIIDFLMANPDVAGGRLWSAQFDDYTSSSVEKDFGKLRRVF
jgi:NAD(P)-dependent dehydrogenase (short-subunit alcohol dehydrogenase family)